MFGAIVYTDFIDIAVMTVIIYFVLVFFKRSRAAFVLTGMIIAAAAYLVARQFNLVLTSNVFQWFFAVILVAWVVIFQEEIRRFFEQIAVWSFRRRFGQAAKAGMPREDIAALVRTIADLARDRIGALIVLPGKATVLGHLSGGTELMGRFSEALIKSIFDTHSIGHDGAVVVEEDMVTQFGVHLPLSKNFAKLKGCGTRHAAALGLAELSDALCIVVSEERGTVSIAHSGDLREIKDADALLGAIERFRRETAPPGRHDAKRHFFRRNLREKIIALVLTLLLWFVQVYGSQLVYRTFSVPVVFAQPHRGGFVMSAEPASVDVTFSGPRRVLLFVKRDELKVVLRRIDDRPGARNVRISGANVAFPKSLMLEEIEPKSIVVTLREVDEMNE